MAVSLAPALKDLVKQAGDAGVSGAQYINSPVGFVTLVDPSNDRTSRVSTSGSLVATDNKTGESLSLVQLQLRKGFRYPHPGELNPDGTFADGRKQHNAPRWMQQWADEAKLEETPDEAVVRLEAELARVRENIARKDEKVILGPQASSTFQAIPHDVEKERFTCGVCRMQTDTEHGMKIHMARVHGGKRAKDSKKLSK